MEHRQPGDGLEERVGAFRRGLPFGEYPQELHVSGVDMHSIEGGGHPERDIVQPYERDDDEDWSYNPLPVPV